LQRGYFEPQAIRTIMDEHFRGRRDRAGLLWILLVFELWHRNFLEAQTPEAPETNLPVTLQNVLSPGGDVL
jgi:hypothetical protein